MKTTIAIFALALLTSLGCSDSQGIATTPNTLAATAADLNANGVPDLFDNCPTQQGAADFKMVGADLAGLACVEANDCLLNGDITKLADGTLVPVATNQGTSSPVGVFCVESVCMMQLDTDLDGAGDACDQDDDNDKIIDGSDNCPTVANPTQDNTDGDTQGNICDADDDNDTVLDGADNCPLVSNLDQLDTDLNGKGDVCDGDDDGDGILDGADNCPLLKNGDQLDTDEDGLGDVCDLDDDGDSDPDTTDCAPLDPAIFVGQIEACNGIDDSCDGNTDESFVNTDGDLLANCVDTDDDGDTVLDTSDNCPLVVNTNQLDTDEDGLGDLCDTDDDADTILDAADNCPLIANTNQSDLDEDGQGDLCDGDCDGDGIPNSTPCTGDLDGDSFVPPQDCLEGNSTVHPGATELCNGVDDDCDGSTDESSICPSGKVCGGLMGCVSDPDAPPGPECTIGADCDDGDACKTDSCVAQVCAHASVSCDDLNVCTTDTCSPATGCVHTAVAACCNTAAQCDDANASTVDQCTAAHVCTHAPACVPVCDGKQCGSNGCEGTCGSCTGTDICDATGKCQAAPQAGTITTTWAFDPASIPTAVSELRLMAVCKDASSTVTIPWGMKASALKPYPTSLTFTAVDAALASCEVNIVGLAAGKPVFWATSGDGLGGQTTIGIVSYSFFDGLKTIAAIKVGTKDNLQGGFNFYFAPDTDNDGDGKSNATDPDPADATK